MHRKNPHLSLFGGFRCQGKRVGGGVRGEGIHLSLAEREPIDAAADPCAAPVRAWLSCAGIADQAPDIEKIHLIGHRHPMDRILERGMLDGGCPSTG